MPRAGRPQWWFSPRVGGGERLRAFSPQIALIAGLLLAVMGLALMVFAIFQLGKSLPQNVAQVQAMEGHQTSEFWIVFGHSIKITDTLLVIFTFLVFVATALLWWSTKNPTRYVSWPKSRLHNPQYGTRKIDFAKSPRLLHEGTTLG